MTTLHKTRLAGLLAVLLLALTACGGGTARPRSPSNRSDSSRSA